MQRGGPCGPIGLQGILRSPGRGAILFAIDQGLLDWDETISDIMYTTQNDGLIQEWCVGNYDHEELVLDARAKIFETKYNISLSDANAAPLVIESSAADHA